MAERDKLDPTIDEIVVALRETTRGAGRAGPFTVVGGRQSEGNRASGVTSSGSLGAASRGRGTAAVSHTWTGPTEINELRDGEIERLLTENARHNERVVFLLKVIEREQARNAELAAEQASTETDRGAIVREVRAAIATELRPVLLLVLRLLQTQRADGSRRARPEATARSAISGRVGDGTGNVVAAMSPLSSLRRRAARALAALHL